MASREQQRAAAVPAIAQLARSPDFRSVFTIAGGYQQVIIPALPDDTVRYVLDRLAEAGGRGVLVLVTECGVMLVASLAPVSEARLGVAIDDEQVATVHPDVRVDMFFDYLQQVETVVVHRVTARLVDNQLA